ncbi:MAG: hypothetical protein ABIR23_04175 [Novosphingobium sp.]
MARAASAQNAVKHGLFCARSFAPFELPAPLAALAEELAALAGGRFDALNLIEAALLAGLRLAEATALLERMQAQARAGFVKFETDYGPLVELIPQMTRMARYQRRFRRQRDKALAVLLDLTSTELHTIDS